MCSNVYATTFEHILNGIYSLQKIYLLFQLTVTVHEAVNATS